MSEYKLGYRVSQDAVRDLRYGCGSSLRQGGLLLWWREATSRLSHAWRALVHGECDE